MSEYLEGKSIHLKNIFRYRRGTKSLPLAYVCTYVRIYVCMRIVYFLFFLTVVISTPVLTVTVQTE